MPIHRERKLIFIHIPKTGGTTVEKILGLYEPWPAVCMDILRGPYERDGEQLHMQHLNSDELSGIAGIDFSTWYQFAFVRNPWDRLVSAFCFKNRDKDRSPVAFAGYVDWVETVVDSREFLASDNCHLRPQVEFLADGLDFLGRFENFEQDLTLVLKELGVSLDTIPHEHKSKRGHYSEYYDERTMRKVGEIYAEDIAQLNYTFEYGSKSGDV